MWSGYTLHKTAGEIELKAGNIEELRSELDHRLADGEFEKEMRRWMPVSTPDKCLVGRVDYGGKGWEFGGFGKGVGSEIPPYVIHTTGGDVKTAAWSVHEFRIELGRYLDVGRFDDAPNVVRSRTVTQGGRRVGLIDWETGEFTPTDKTEEVAYWVRHGAGLFPTDARDLAGLRDELTPLTRSDAFWPTAQGGHLVDVQGPRGVVERRVAAYSPEYREEAVAVPYTVYRERTVAGSHRWCNANETGELAKELEGRLHRGEFQTEEDLRMRWLPVTQGDFLAGYVDPAERRFVPEEKRTIRYRIDTEESYGVPMAADALEGLRAELEARWEDLRHLVEGGRDSNPVFDVGEGRRIGRVDDGRLLLSGTDEDGPDGTSCESCWYWRLRDEVPVRGRDTDRIEAIASQGQCRRWSPHPRHGWPVTTCDSWCGEYRSRKGPG